MSSSDTNVVTWDAADKQTVFRGFGAFAAKEELKPLAYNPPTLKDDFVEVEIECCGICGSDIHTLDSGWGPTNYPVIVGHEIIGRVAAVGDKVSHLKVGDRVGIGAQCGSCMAREKECPECTSGNENHCRQHLVWTYNTKHPSGEVTQGGYADRVRCQGDFVFRIPDSISSTDAAPLMCAGVTVFAPLQRYITRPGMKVGVVGIGGLGHLGVMFASKMQGGDVEVTAISHSARKKDDALKMGAKHFLDTSDKDAVKAAFRQFDVILCTANGSDMAFNEWLSMVAFDGTFCTVGLPEEPLKIYAFALMGAQVNLTASGIGSIKEIRQMLEFADKHNVRPIVEKFPMEQVNEGLKHVRDGKVRYRVVLENPKK